MTNTGYKQSLYWANETNYGSTATVNRAFGLVQSVNPTETNSLIKVRTLGGNRDYSNIVPGKFEVSGSFEYFLQDCAFLRQGWSEDTASTATVDSGPKIHTGASYLHVLGSAASPLVDDFPSFTMEFSDDESTAGTYNLHRTYRGCRVNNMTVSASVDEPVKIAVDWMAQGVTMSTSGATSVTEGTEDPFVFYQGVVYSTSGAITAYDTVESTSRIAEVNSFDVSVNNNLEAVWYISGTTNAYHTKRELKKLVPKGRDYEANLGLHFADKTMYQRFLGSDTATTSQTTLSEYQVALDFVRTGTIGATPKVATDDWFRIILRSCKFNDINIAGAPEDIVSQNIGVFVEASKLYVVDNDDSYSD